MLESEYEEWKRLQKELKDIKEREMYLRLKIVAFCIQDENAVGTFKAAPFGEDLKIVRRDAFTIDEDELRIYWHELTDADKLCIQYKPVLVKPLYAKLGNKSALKLRAVIRKIATPSIAIVPPKKH